MPLAILTQVQGDVRFGSKADMCSAQDDVRFTPESGHLNCTRECPLYPQQRTLARRSLECRDKALQVCGSFLSLNFLPGFPTCSAALCLGPFEDRDELRADRNFARGPNGLVYGRWLFDRRTEWRSDCFLRRRRDKSCCLLECRPTSCCRCTELRRPTSIRRRSSYRWLLISPVVPGYLCHASISWTIRSRTRSQLVAIRSTLRSQLRPAFSACSRTMRLLA